MDLPHHFLPEQGPANCRPGAYPDPELMEQLNRRREQLLSLHEAMRTGHWQDILALRQDAVARG